MNSTESGIATHSLSVVSLVSTAYLTNRPAVWGATVYPVVSFAVRAMDAGPFFPIPPSVARYF